MGARAFQESKLAKVCSKTSNDMPRIFGAMERMCWKVLRCILYRFTQQSRAAVKWNLRPRFWSLCLHGVRTLRPEEVILPETQSEFRHSSSSEYRSEV